MKRMTRKANEALKAVPAITERVSEIPTLATNRVEQIVQKAKSESTTEIVRNLTVVLLTGVALILLHGRQLKRLPDMETAKEGLRARPTWNV